MVPKDVADRSAALAHLPGVYDGAWRPCSPDERPTFALEVPFGWWLLTDPSDPDDGGAVVRRFTTWDEVRVALDEVEERGSWWPDP